jgi:hypothetical protein
VLIHAQKDHLAMQVSGLFKLEYILARRKGSRSKQGIGRTLIDQRSIDVTRAKRAPSLRVKQVCLRMPVLRQFVLDSKLRLERPCLPQVGSELASRCYGYRGRCRDEWLRV